MSKPNAALVAAPVTPFVLSFAQAGACCEYSPAILRHSAALGRIKSLNLSAGRDGLLLPDIEAFKGAPTPTRDGLRAHIDEAIGDRRTLSLFDVARGTTISRRTAVRLIAAGDLPARYEANRWLVDAVELREWILARRTERRVVRVRCTRLAEVSR